jgi:DNA-directed RNA polymerase specialized sigma24 family protein
MHAIYPSKLLRLGNEGHQLRDISKVKAWLFTTMNRAFLTGQKRQISVTPP